MLRATATFETLKYCRLRLRVGQGVALHIVLACVISRLDFCNEVYAELLFSTIVVLKQVQNTAAWFQLVPQDHISFPGKSRIINKLFTFMCSIKLGQCPGYLSALVSQVSMRPSNYSLCLADCDSLELRRLCTTFSECAFFAWCRTWSSSAADIWAASSQHCLKWLVKTRLFYRSISRCHLIL